MLVLLSIITVSCAIAPHVKIYDKRVCADFLQYGAKCDHTYLHVPEKLTAEQWDQERHEHGQMCMRSEDFADTENAIDQVCLAFKKCDYVTKEIIKSAFKRFNPMINESIQIRSELRETLPVEK